MATPFYLLSYVTPIKIFHIGDHKKTDMVKYTVTYHNFLNLGNICKWPVLDKLSDVQIPLYICTEFDKFAT